MTMYTVEIANVTKTFGKVTAVDDLSLSMPRSSIYGFIGRNGSGKTTTLRMIMNIFYPDSDAAAAKLHDDDCRVASVGGPGGHYPVCLPECLGGRASLPDCNPYAGKNSQTHHAPAMSDWRIDIKNSGRKKMDQAIKTVDITSVSSS